MTEQQLLRQAKRRLAILQHRRGSERQRRSNLPLLRDQPNLLLQVAAPL